MIVIMIRSSIENSWPGFFSEACFRRIRRNSSGEEKVSRCIDRIFLLPTQEDVEEALTVSTSL